MQISYDKKEVYLVQKKKQKNNNRKQIFITILELCFFLILKVQNKFNFSVCVTDLEGLSIADVKE